MIRIINGKRYNTKTATYIGNACYSCGGDFHHYDEDLYVTKKGAYFLKGIGGPMSRWSVSTGQNSWSGGSGIQVLDAQEALEWAERHLDEDDIAEFFADQIEDA